MSSLVLGAAQFGLNYGINNKHGQVSTEKILEILKLALENEIREIDTAQDYGNSEQILGLCLEDFKSKFIVHSKFVPKGRSISESINDSLKNLKINELGFFYFHRFSDYQDYKAQEADKGQPIGHCLGLAVSVYEVEELELATTDPEVKAIQVPLNLFDSSDEKIRLIKLAQLAGKKIYIRSVFLQGLFFMDASNLPPKLQPLAEPLSRLNNICHKYKVDMKTLALGYIKGVVSADGVLIGVDTREQLQENINAWSNQLDTRLIDEVRNIEISDKNLLLPKNWN